MGNGAFPVVNPFGLRPPLPPLEPPTYPNITESVLLVPVEPPLPPPAADAVENDELLPLPVVSPESVGAPPAPMVTV